jgi:hypothetical protein
MGEVWLAVLLSASFLLAQGSNPNAASQQNSKGSKDEITIQGCVSRRTGNYILVKQNPPSTYMLQATGKIKLGPYLGQRVEITGTESPSLSTSSDALSRLGSPSPVTIRITSIKTVAQQCPVHPVPN